MRKFIEDTLEWLSTNKYSYIDIITLVFAMSFMYKEQWLAALATFIIGVLISTIAKIYFKDIP